MKRHAAVQQEETGAESHAVSSASHGDGLLISTPREKKAKVNRFDDLEPIDLVSSSDDFERSEKAEQGQAPDESQGFTCHVDCFLFELDESRPNPEENIEKFDLTTLPDQSEQAKQLYRPIKNWQTRLLCLQAGAKKDPVVVMLTIADLIFDSGLVLHHEQVQLEYEALSYCWGVPVFDHCIECNGLAYPVTRNLFNALQRLRHPESPRYVWIDALCINQHDDDERSAQVRKMVNIYHKALKVVVWLGDDNEVFGTLLPSLKDSSLFKLLQQDDVVICERHRGLIADQLCENPWFCRSWVQQEVWAAEAIEVLWGPHTISWESFNAIWKKIVGNPQLQGSIKEDAQIYKDIKDEAFEDRPSFYAIFHEPSKAMKASVQRREISSVDIAMLLNESQPAWARSYTELLSAMERTNFCECSDARDRVYALLGMVIHNRPTNNGRVSFPAIDYGKSVAEVYCDVVAYYLGRSGGLNFFDLLFRDIQRGIRPCDEMPFGGHIAGDRLPSWCPNWELYFARTLREERGRFSHMWEQWYSPDYPSREPHERKVSEVIRFPTLYIQGWKLGQIGAAKRSVYYDRWAARGMYEFEVRLSSLPSIAMPNMHELRRQAAIHNSAHVFALTRMPRPNDLVVDSDDLSIHFLVVGELPEGKFELVGFVDPDLEEHWTHITSRSKQQSEMYTFEFV